MFNLSTDKFNEARVIAASMEKKVRNLRAANRCPAPGDIIPLVRLNRLLDECLALFEDESEKDGRHMEELNQEDRDVLGF